ncbi:histone-lysine N-methyltransferase ASHR2 [Selaginella moellendorffii]|nr:histone-lysine N-methyltransferase ASHR2 [Selaginella moellendorffii]|eukprot:XP_002970670.2 histone-lysine N-methyltransferase ASHR2 [Selaginella moellendorffii]
MEVRIVPGRGRGLFALRDLSGGHIVIRESPLLVYGEAEAAGSFCAHCIRCVSSSSPACESCSKARFCDERCRAAAIASSHTPWMCSALQDVARAGIGHEAGTQARFLLAAVSLAARNAEDFQRLLLLDGQASVFANDPRPAGVAELVLALLRTHCFELAKGLSLEMFLNLLAKDKINAFGLMAPSSGTAQRKVRAYARYAQASMLNHDCLPNACRFEYLDKPGASNTDIYIRLLHDVPQGSEICISYFPVNWNYKERRERLVEDYGFECNCERCRVEQTWSDGDGEGDEEEAMEHDQTDGDGEDEEEEMDKDGDGDFPHAMFFVKYLCPEESCGGTMAPLPGNANLMECNVCGRLRSEQEFIDDLEQHGTARHSD